MKILYKTLRRPPENSQMLGCMVMVPRAHNNIPPCTHKYTYVLIHVHTYIQTYNNIHIETCMNIIIRV